MLSYECVLLSWQITEIRRSGVLLPLRTGEGHFVVDTPGNA